MVKVMGILRAVALRREEEGGRKRGNGYRVEIEKGGGMSTGPAGRPLKRRDRAGKTNEGGGGREMLTGSTTGALMRWAY